MLTGLISSTGLSSRAGVWN